MQKTWPLYGKTNVKFKIERIDKFDFGLQTHVKYE